MPLTNKINSNGKKTGVDCGIKDGSGNYAVACAYAIAVKQVKQQNRATPCLKPSSQKTFTSLKRSPNKYPSSTTHRDRLE
ncbi:MAG: hypothetical protein HC930_08825 [Hydrococcus sp. SU_1_0]|nr:hypothetical protein [Hydrococcus sp. SU_1_0]